MQFIAVEVFIYLFIWLQSFVCLCERQNMSKNGNTSLLLYHFWINFWCLILFTYLKVNIRMRQSGKVWEGFWWVHFLIWIKKKHFFLENCTLISSESYYLFIRPENLNLKFSEKLAALTFLREKVWTFVESKWYMYTHWLLITLCNMPKGLVT